jgi:hypothetical protein
LRAVGTQTLFFGFATFFFGSATLFFGFATFFLGSFFADQKQISLCVVPAEPGCCLVPEKPVPDTQLDSQGLDGVMPARIGFKPPIPGPFETIDFELTRFNDNDGVVTAVDGLLVDPEFPFECSSVPLFRTVPRRVLDDDRRRNVFLPENKSIPARAQHRQGRYVDVFARRP